MEICLFVCVFTLLISLLNWLNYETSSSSSSATRLYSIYTHFSMVWHQYPSAGDIDKTKLDILVVSFLCNFLFVYTLHLTALSFYELLFYPFTQLNVVDYQHYDFPSCEMETLRNITRIMIIGSIADDCNFIFSLFPLQFSHAFSAPFLQAILIIISCLFGKTWQFDMKVTRMMMFMATCMSFVHLTFRGNNPENMSVKNDETLRVFKLRRKSI